MTDWREPDNRQEAFQRLYRFHLEHRAHPGMVYSWLPYIARAYGLTEDQRAWLAWLNACTQNPVTSLLLLEAAPTPERWQDAVAFWNEHFKLLEWDADRRHQKSKFGVATGVWAASYGADPAAAWELHSLGGWDTAWAFSFSQPYLGRLSAWSGLEFARVLLPGLPDATTLLLRDASGSRSHRNGLALVAGAPPEAAYWTWSDYTPGQVEELEELGEELLAEARWRNPDSPDVGYLTLESALCTWKSMWKPKRRYPGVYADMAYYRLRKAEARWGKRFELLWAARQQDLPAYLRLEDNPHDPGLCEVKQDWFRNTGELPVLYHSFPDMPPSGYDVRVGLHHYGKRKGS